MPDTLHDLIESPWCEKCGQLLVQVQDVRWHQEHDLAYEAHIAAKPPDHNPVPPIFTRLPELRPEGLEYRGPGNAGPCVHGWWIETEYGGKPVPVARAEEMIVGRLTISAREKLRKTDAGTMGFNAAMRQSFRTAIEVNATVLDTIHDLIVWHHRYADQREAEE